MFFLRFFSIFILATSCYSNTCFPTSLEMGKWSYTNPNITEWGNGAKATIGKYCSIADNVSIFLGGNHRIKWVTTYPFPVHWPMDRVYPRVDTTKGDVIIGNDVWIGSGALILSGVTIGHGAVIGARAVVAKNVPPYGVVVGNPGRIVKYRFTPNQIEKLLAIGWWDWPEDDIAKAMPFLLNEDIDQFIQYCQSIGKL